MADCSSGGPSLAALPDDVHCAIAMYLLQANDLQAAQQLSWTSRTLHDSLQAVRTLSKLRHHKIRWAVQRLEEDVVIRCRGLRVIGTDASWRRAYGLPLLPKDRVSKWAVRLDKSRRNQGLMLLGVSLQQRTGLCEWCVNPFYGRLFRRSWDKDGNQLLAEPPPGSVAWRTRTLAAFATGPLLRR